MYATAKQFELRSPKYMICSVQLQFFYLQDNNIVSNKFNKKKLKLHTFDYISKITFEFIILTRQIYIKFML